MEDTGPEEKAARTGAKSGRAPGDEKENTSEKRDSLPLARRKSADETFEELIARLTREFSPIDVRSIARTMKPLRARDLVMRITTEWQRRPR